MKPTPEQRARYARTYRAKHRDKFLNYQSEYRRKNKDKIKIWAARQRLKSKKKITEGRQCWRVRNPEGVLRQRLRQRYGITVEQYNDMIQSQNSVCAICGKTMKKICIDHNHTTGKIRGLLCEKCNFGLGQFDDNGDLMLRAIEYLSQSLVA